MQLTYYISLQNMYLQFWTKFEQIWSNLDQIWSYFLKISKISAQPYAQQMLNFWLIFGPPMLSRPMLIKKNMYIIIQQDYCIECPECIPTGVPAAMGVN